MGVLLVIAALVLTDTVFERESQSESAASRVGTHFVWPEHPRAADPDAALRILVESADATGSNVLRTSVRAARSGRKQITHYILMGRGETGLFGEFALAQGRWFSQSESRTGPVTVSSARVGAQNNVGVPAVFGDRFDLTFAPLRQAFESLPSSGLYVIEARDIASREAFLAMIHQRLVAAGVADLSVAALTPARIQIRSESGNFLRILAYILAIVATLAIAFVLLREGKRIGVLRLMGHPTTRIWYMVVGRLQLASLLVGLCACVVVAFAVPGVDAFFLRTLAITFIEVALAGSVVTMGIGLAIVNRVRVADLIKGGMQ